MTIEVKGPYDLTLCLKATASFSPLPQSEVKVFRAPVWVEQTPALLTVRQLSGDPAQLEISDHGTDLDRLQEIASWVLFAELDLAPFYQMAASNATLKPVVHRLHGLKPIRPASLFEMTIIAITEQQISVAAAYRIRTRLVQRFGPAINGFFCFPTAKTLAQASLPDLMACGLSRRKSEYISGLAQAVAQGALDLERLKELPDGEVRQVITSIRGLGNWTADYILIRGLARLNCFPAADLGIRTVVGKYLGGTAARLTPDQVNRALEPFFPFRGLAAFYLLVYDRLAKS